MNLAGVLPWIHWRGLLILGLLAAGNVFCMALSVHCCRGRSPAAGCRPAGAGRAGCGASGWRSSCSSLFLWAYEAFALWDSPWWTAWIALGYFAAAFVIDGFFRGASFCKYVCPIGQFNFVQSLVSPLEVQGPRPGRLRRRAGRRIASAAATASPAASCTCSSRARRATWTAPFCLDCVHACPHDNVGMLADAPDERAVERPPPLRHRPLRPPPRPGGPDRRAGVRRLRQRRGHGRPGGGVADPILVSVGPSLSLLAMSLFYLPALVVLPLLAVGVAAALSRRWGRRRRACWRRRLATPTPWCRSGSACGWRTTASTS